jgi:WD40 repeat protein
MKRIHTIVGKNDRKPNYFSISADSRTLISNAHSLESGEEQYETVRFWDLVTGQLVRTVDFRHDHVSVTAYEKWLVGIVYNADVIIRLNLATNEIDFILDAAPRCLYNQKSNVTPLTASLYEPIIACGVRSQAIAAYNLLADPVSSDGFAINLRGQKFRSEHSLSNSSVLISPDSNVLLSQTLHPSCGFHHLWDLRTGELIRTFNISTFGFAEYISINYLGQVLACGSFLDLIQVWDVHTGNIMCSLDGNLPATMSIDGKLLAYCDCEMNIILWNIMNNQKIGILTGSLTKIEKIACSPDGKWLASYHQGQEIEIWSIQP